MRSIFWFCKSHIQPQHHFPSTRTVAAAFCLASSMACFMQAALHLPSLVALLMLSVSMGVQDYVNVG